MSLEAAVQENTAALKAFTAALSSAALLNAGPATGAAPDKAETKTVEPKKAPPKKATAKAEPLPAAEEAEQGADEAIPYEAVREKTLATVKDHGRDFMAPIFEKFGVTTAKDLKPEDYYDYLQAIDRATAADAEDEVA